MAFSGVGGGMGGGGDNGVDPEIQRFIEIETQKAKFQANVNTFTDVCWEKCMEKLPTRADPKTEMCFTNCVERFMDTTNFVLNKLSTLKQH